MPQQLFDVQVTEFLSELSRIEQAVANRVPDSDEHLRDLAIAIREQSRVCLEFEAEFAGQPSEMKQLQGAFQSAIDPWFRQSWFMHRAKTKPRGYPGDYATLNGIYDNQPQRNGFGGYLDLYFLQSDLARAVRSRMECARQFLSQFISSRPDDEPIEILNVASGPGREYFVGLEYPADKQVHITCIDSDSEALNHVSARVQDEANQPELSFVNYNALRMRSSGKNTQHFGTPDVIYSIGLFDYLPDNHLIAILSGLRKTVRPGGVVYVAFKDELLYDKAEYQWFVDWYFFQRTEADCHRLLIEAGFENEEISVTRDETRIIMNFIASVPITESLRIDDAKGLSPMQMEIRSSEQQSAS